MKRSEELKILNNEVDREAINKEIANSLSTNTLGFLAYWNNEKLTGNKDKQARIQELLSEDTQNS